jgi:hypothetical protein
VAEEKPLTAAGAAINVLHPGWLKEGPAEPGADNPPAATP